MSIQVEPITLRQHLLNPFSFKVSGSKNFTALISKRDRIIAIVAAVATAIIGLPFAIVGGPLVFYFFTRQFKNKRIEQLQQVPRGPVPGPSPEPVAGPVTPGRGSTWTPLHEACAKGNIDQVRTLIDRRAALSATDSNGNTPLHVAASNGHQAIVKLLLERGAARGFNSGGKSPLALAVERVIPSLNARYNETPSLINLICSHPLARTNTDRIVEALVPFAKYDVARHLLLSNNSNASTLLDRLMLSVLREQHLVDAGNEAAFNRQLRAHPFIFSIDNNEVLVHTMNGQDVLTNFLTKQQFYTVWVQHEGNLQQMKGRIIAARDRPIEVLAAQPAVVVDQFPGFGLAGLGGAAVPAFGGASYYISVKDSNELKANPEATIEQLCKQFDRSKCHMLRVTYQGGRGVDAGGLRRQFIADLFSNLSSKLGFHRFDNGLYRPKCRPDADYPVMNAKDKKHCEDLGKMMMFLLNAAEEYPTGLIFDPGTFVALVRMDHRYVNQKFEDIKFDDQATYNAMFAIYKAMNQSNEDETKGIKRMEGYLALTNASKDQDLKDAFASVMADDNIERLNIAADNVVQIKQHLNAIKAAVKSSMIENMKATFGPIHAIAVGMKSSSFDNKFKFSEMPHKTPAEISKQLQGVASKQDIISRVQFYGGIGTTVSADKLKTWFTNWINKLDEKKPEDAKKLELFLYAATGSTALGSGSRINFMHTHVDPNSTRGGFAFHSCSGQIDLNYNEMKNESDLASILEAHLELIKNTPDFNMA